MPEDFNHNTEYCILRKYSCPGVFVSNVSDSCWLKRLKLKLTVIIIPPPFVSYIHCNSNTWFRAIVIGVCCHFKHFISHIVTTRLYGVESTGSYINLLGEVSENLNTWGDYGVRTLVSDVMKMTNKRLSGCLCF
jgi:hypothetical protein